MNSKQSAAKEEQRLAIHRGRQAMRNAEHNKFTPGLKIRISGPQGCGKSSAVLACRIAVAMMGIPDADVQERER